MRNLKVWLLTYLVGTVAGLMVFYPAFRKFRADLRRYGWK